MIILPALVSVSRQFHLYKSYKCGYIVAYLILTIQGIKIRPQLMFIYTLVMSGHQDSH